MVLIERNEKMQRTVPKLLQKRGGPYFERRAKHSQILVQKIIYKKANPFYQKNPKENHVVLDFLDSIFSKGNLRFPFFASLIKYIISIGL
jgi:hypothetical protein